MFGTMNEQQARFVETMGQMLAGQGLPPMAGRMWGWLLICEPPDQTAGDLSEALGASRGSISGTARILVTAGLVHRSTRRGDRREYFSVPPGATAAMVMGQIPRLRAFRQVTELGLDLLRDRPPDVKARIQEVHDLYSFFERVYPDMIERFHRDQAAESVERTA
jgi:DNA-binding transcriptional regulator GbsR (MarR family)